jgi:hypothetical protein
MIQSRKWTRIERLPDDPNVAKMTSKGYWLNGRFHPTQCSPRALPLEQPRKGWLGRIFG